jgi:hypothetical protein
MEYLWAWGTLIHEKNLSSKISCQTPFKRLCEFEEIHKRLREFEEIEISRQSCRGDSD